MRRVDVERVMAQRAEIVLAARAAVEAGAIPGPVRLSRRHRWTLLDMTRDGDIAAVAAARRGKRAGLTIDAFVFRREGEEWVTDWPSVSREHEAPTLPPRRFVDSGAFSEGSSAGDPTDPRCSVGVWCVVPEGKVLREGETERPVPEHGWVVTLGAGGADPTEVLDGQGRLLGLLSMPRHPRMPWHVHARMWWHQHRPGHRQDASDAWVMHRSGWGIRRGRS